jgi:hypothetical protein
METCKFGCGPAAVYVELSRGCVCFPDDREQFLCNQHWYKMEPLGTVKAIEIQDYYAIMK